MHNTGELYDRRRSDYWQKAIRYLRLIGNSGFLFSLYLLFVFGSYYYGQLLQWLPESFPARLTVGIVLVWFVTRGRVRTFIREADVVFLTPLEDRMNTYIKKGMLYSWLMESFYTALVILLFTPLMMDRFVDSTSAWLIIVLAVVLLKGWNLLAGFEEQRFQDDRNVYQHTTMRAAVNAVVIIALFDMQSVWTIMLSMVLLLAVYGFYFRKLSKMYLLKWHRLVAIEQKTTMTFYRIANSFTDVPALKSTVKKRRFADVFLSFTPYGHDHFYRYLMGRSFFRADDYFGIYIRLTAVGAVFTAAVHLDWGQWLVGGAFSVLTAMQIATLKDHYNTKQMIELYPVNKENRLDGHKYWMRRLLMIQGVAVGSLVALFTAPLQGLIVFIVMAICSFWLSDLYLRKAYNKRYPGIG